MRQQLLTLTHRVINGAAAVGLLLFAVPLPVHAAASNTAPAAKVSFTFDDGLASTYTAAQPTLAKYGLTGTDYVITGCIGMTTTPNTCHANNDNKYMTWQQVQALQNTYHWDIGSHTVTHPYLATFDASDGQPNPLTPAQVTQELTQSKADLAAHGINATDFSTPYGDYNNFTLQEIAKLYATHRGFFDVSNNDWPYNDLLLNDYQVQGGVTVAQVESKIDDAIANNRWLVLTMHEIKTNASTNADDYQWGTAKLDKVAAYVKAKQDAGLIKSVAVNQGAVTSDTNLLPNSSFNSGLSGGWTTDDPADITADSGNHGNCPDPTNSIKLVATSANKHLFSPQVAVDPSTTYMLKNFASMQNYSSGELAFYIDEYDSAGNWISGQYKTAVRSGLTQDVNFTYKPSSMNVAKASLQVIVTGGSGITAYFDNPQWFPLTSVAAPTNLVANGTFDNGIADGWSTDSPTTITADSGNHGSPANPVNSVYMTATTANKHLFSPKITVSSTKTYSISGWLNITALTSNEVGFYIDEYNSAGSWISGQYKTGVRAVGASTVSLNYTPSSTSVASASLQVIVTGNSGITAYFDDVKWYQN